MIEELVRKEVAWLAQQEGKTLNKMLRVYQDTFLELEEKLKPLAGKNTYTARQLRATQAQIGAVMEGMRDQHSSLLGKQVRTVFNQQIPRDKKAWQKLEQVFGDPATAKQFGEFKPLVPQEAIKALVTTQDISIKGFNEQLTKQVRASIAQGMAQGEGAQELVRRLAPFKSSAKNQTHLHLIVRMETARSSNLAKIETIKQLQKEFPEREYWLQIKDRIDKSKGTRNHWLSWAISGTVACITRKEYFEVTTADLDAAKAEYKKITGKKAYDSGVLWKKGGVGRRGRSVPAHFWDRAVLVPWDPSWSVDVFGEFKHPQGPVIQMKKNQAGVYEADAEEQKAVPTAPPKAKSTAKERIRRRKLKQIVFHQPQPGIDFEALEFDDDFPAFLEKYQLKGGLIQKPIRHELWDFEKQFLGLRHERGVLFDVSGVKPAYKDGTFNSLPYDWDELKPFRNGRFSHYHPGSYSFSDMDILNAIICNFKEMRVICPHEKDYYLFSIERKGSFWRKLWGKEWQWNSDDLVKIHDIYNIALQEKKQELTTSGLGAKTANFESSHYAVQQACKAMNVVYRKIKLSDL